jgi:hypothetical protein
MLANLLKLSLGVSFTIRTLREGHTALEARGCKRGHGRKSETELIRSKVYDIES